MSERTTVKLTDVAQQLLLALWRADEDGDGFVQMDNQELARLAGFVEPNWGIFWGSGCMELEQRGFLLYLLCERPNGGHGAPVYILRDEEAAT